MKTLTAPAPIDTLTETAREWILADAGNMVLAYALGVAALAWAAAWAARQF